MRHCTTIALALVVAALTLLPGTAAAHPEGALGDYDIGELLERAESAWDMEQLDAVVLLDRESVIVEEDGARTTRVHRIVWMATELALETYADLRVPWNTETSELRVIALRTWRDDRWWPHENEISETAVVQTIPGALRGADDYTTIWETMLLHDGVELPCVVETAYEITERPRARSGGTSGGSGAGPLEDEVARPSHYGAWVFPKSDPCVVSRLDLSVPAGGEPHSEAMNGAPSTPASARTPAHGVRYTWEMEELDRLPSPLTAHPEGDAPHIVWSTWASWEALGAWVARPFDGATELSQSLRDSVAARIEDEPNEWSKARAVAELVSEGTRLTRYPDRFWEGAPRAATRTWETAYGHRLDRAVLAAALLREAGFGVRPAYVGSAVNRSFATQAPSLVGFAGVSLEVRAPGLVAIYDPTGSAVTPAVGATAGRSVWIIGDGDRAPAGPVPPEGSELEIVVELEPGEESWSGTGYLRATHSMSPYTHMHGLANEAMTHLGRLSGSLVSGSDLTEWSALVFSPEVVACGFGFTHDPGEKDRFGRISISLGDPEGGVLDRLPPDVHLYDAQRESPVLLAAQAEQRLTLRIAPGELEIAHQPEPVSLENGVGSFELEVDNRDDGTLTVRRVLKITSSRIEPGQWPLLRALLLAETHERNRRILLR